MGRHDGVYTLNRAAVLLFIGAVGKSAQLGLHTWLPDAMEGPTPVSALIHAATMVTAGVFRLARCSPLLEYAPDVLAGITVVGALTAFVAGTIGLVQHDRKRVIAYSTCSQLGYMIFACGLSGYEVGVFHLSNHAAFKALLFLSAGSVIHAMADEQDIRRMGGRARILPLTYSMFLIGSRARLGFPFLTGFYSKDVILEVAYASYTPSGHRAYVLGTASAFCTAFYSVRLRYRTFRAEPAGYRASYEHAHDAPIRMAVPLLVLAVGALFLGYVSKDRFIGRGSPYWGQALYVLPSANGVPTVEAEFVPHTFKFLPVRCASAGAVLGFAAYSTPAGLRTRYTRKTTTSHPFGYDLYTFLSKKWFFDKVYTETIVQPALHSAYHGTYHTMDRGRIERRGPYGLSLSVTAAGTRRTSWTTGSLPHYRAWRGAATVGLRARLYRA